MGAYQGLLLLPGTAQHMAHERMVQRQLGEKLAALLGCPFLGPHQLGTQFRGRHYFLPEDTLIGDVGADSMVAMTVPPGRSTRATSVRVRRTTVSSPW